MQLVSARPPQQSSYNPQQQNSYTTPQEPVYQAPAAATDPFAGQQMPNDDLPF
jgi:hypothetical protein